MLSKIIMSLAMLNSASLAHAAPACAADQTFVPFSRAERVKARAERLWVRILRAELVKNDAWREVPAFELMLVTDIVPTVLLSNYTIKLARAEAHRFKGWRASLADRARLGAIANRPLVDSGLEINSTLVARRSVAEARASGRPGFGKLAATGGRGLGISLLTGASLIMVTNLGRTAWQIAMKKETFAKRRQLVSDRLEALDFEIARNGFCR